MPLGYLYQATRHYYGDEGQEIIDPVVFFKICLVGYLNNINFADDLRKTGFSKDGIYSQPQVVLGLLVSDGGFPNDKINSGSVVLCTLSGNKHVLYSA